MSVSTPAGDRVLRRASAEVPRRVQQSSAEAVRLGSAPAIEWFFLELTTACNYACTYCPRPLLTRPQGAMPFDRARAALEMIAAYRRRHPLLQNYAEARHPVFLHVMGEPLLYPRLVELLAHGRGLGLDFALVTNASLLTPEVGAALLDVGVHSVVMSLNAPDARSYAATGAGAPFDEVVRNIQAFVAERARRDAVLPRVEIQLLSSRGAEIAAGPLVETPAQVQEQLAFWSDLVRDVEAEAGAAAPAGREAATWPRALEQPPWDPAHYLPIGRHVWLVVKRACNFANALLPPGRGVRPAGTGRCLFGAPERTFCIFWDGTASFCSLDYDNEVNLGDVFEHGIEALWAGRRMSRIRDLMRRGRLPEALCRRCLGRVVPASAVPRPGRRPT
nr:radical SAM/SPASM domain-containing protein [Dissulfurirhabdus thermomarina]